MGKTERTKTLERLLMHKFKDRSDFYVFECTIGWCGKEVVDCICYNCDREVLCYEIKQSVADFHSKRALTFIGNKNYFVMPYSLYEKVKDEIPDDIGCYVAVDHIEFAQQTIVEKYRKVVSSQAVLYDGLNELHCIKSARRRDLRADKEVILSSMLRCSQRDFNRGSRFPVIEHEKDGFDGYATAVCAFDKRNINDAT